jgi:hypothetical protein
VAESLRPDVTLDVRQFGVRSMRRHAPSHTATYQPDTWTHIEFEVAESDAVGLAERLAEVLDKPGWYVYLRSSTEALVVYPGRVFRYQRGDVAARNKAQEYGRQVGVPGYQLDWPA